MKIYRKLKYIGSRRLHIFMKYSNSGKSVFFKSFLCLFFVLSLLLSNLYFALALPEIILHDTFEDSVSISLWKGNGGNIVHNIHGKTGSLSLVNKEQNSIVQMHRELRADLIAGQFITLKAFVKASNVSNPPKSWNGIKTMVVLTLDNDHKIYPQITFPHGSFEWNEYSTSFRAPTDLKHAKLVIGLEKSSGSIWIDEVKISAGLKRKTKKSNPVMFRGHPLERLRGVMYGPKYQPEDIEELSKWNVNIIRWQLRPIILSDEDRLWDKYPATYETLLYRALFELDKALPYLKKYGIKVLLDLHFSPGGRSEKNECTLFFNKADQEQLINIWKRIALRYRDEPQIFAYDLLNEPNEPQSNKLITWRDIASAAILAIRTIDKEKLIIYQATLSGINSFDLLEPIEFESIIYSFHIYSPLSYTHQGLSKFKEEVAYPGLINGILWDKERLREALFPAIQFQQTFNVHLIVGEFSAIRWAPGAHLYLKDLIELFEEYNWDWVYHAYREFNGWSLEYGPDISENNPSLVHNKRRQLLQDWFNKNEMFLPYVF